MPDFQKIGDTSGTTNQYGNLDINSGSTDGSRQVYLDSKSDTLLIEQKTGANSTDTLERFTLDGKQYQRVTGSFSLNPNSPKLFAGYIRVDGDGPPGGPDGGNKALASNPWFNPSFLANFNNIMAECFDLNSKQRFMEGTLEIKGGQLELAIAKDKSEMTKLATDARVSAKRIEAFACFAQAAISAIALKSTMSNSVKARQTCEAKVKVSQDKYKEQKLTYETKNADLGTKNKIMHDDNKIMRENNQKLERQRDEGPPTVAMGRDQVPPTPEQKKEWVDKKNAEIDKNNKIIEDNETKIEGNNKEIDRNTKFIDEAQAGFDRVSAPEYLDGQIATEVQSLNLQTNMKKEVMQNVINGSSKFVESSYEQEEGYINAFIQELDGYSRAMSRYTDNASKAEGKSASLTDAVNNLMMKITDNSFQASNIGHALG